MNVSELWMKLEALAHLRGMPKLANLRKKLEDELDEENAYHGPKEEPKEPPTVEPPIDSQELEGEEPVVEEDESHVERRV